MEQSLEFAGMHIIGLTGRIGTGKSTVGHWLADLGAHVLDSDSLVHELYASDTALQAALRERFGDSVVRGRSVDRAALGAAVFDRPDALASLEALVHPAVRTTRDASLASARERGVPVAAVEAIKLVESGGSNICDELWIVVAMEEVQLKRLAARGMMETDARRRMAAQGTIQSWSAAYLEESAGLGHTRPVVVFDNSGSEAQGRELAERLWFGISARDGRVAR